MVILKTVQNSLRYGVTCIYKAGQANIKTGKEKHLCTFVSGGSK